MTATLRISEVVIIAVAAMLPIGSLAAEAQPAASAPQPAKAAKAKADSSGGQSLGLGNHDSNAPIDITADNFDYDMNAKIGTYTGNVIVIQGDMRMRSDNMKVNVVQGKPTQIVAAGHVVVNAPSGNATGDKGVYDPGPRTITMTGNVVLTKEKDVMRGTKLVMDMNTNVAHLYAQGMPGGRVRGLFIPPPKQNATGGTAGKTGGAAKKASTNAKPAGGNTGSGDTAPTKTKPAGGDTGAAQPSE